MRSVLVGVLLLATTASSEAFTENDLMMICENPSSARCVNTIIGITEGYMEGYMRGAANILGRLPESQRLATMAKGYLSTYLPWCFTDDVTATQIADAVVQKMEATPGIRHSKVEILVADTLKEAWPCKE